MKRGLTVLVCGGRACTDAAMINLVLTALHRERGISRLVHGAAPGADALAKQWAADHRIPSQGYPAQWDRYGKAAGPIRNRVMIRVEHPDLVIAFPGNQGTSDMVKAAREAGIELYDVRGRS